MVKFLGNSAMPDYIKITAVGLLATTYVAALVVAAQTYITNGPTASLPNVVSVIIGTGLGTALQILGIHQGAQLAAKAPTGNEA